MLRFDDLNDAQKQAVKFPFDRPLKVTAGAGTGKTTVITFRFLEALEVIKNAKPENIACLTFTERAADSMRERIIDALGGNIQPEDLWVQTFHSFCARALARYAPLTLLPAGYRVAAEAETAIMRDDISASFASGDRIAPEERSLIAPGKLRPVIAGSWWLIDSARQNLHTPDTFSQTIEAPGEPEDDYGKYCLQVGRIAAKLFEAYRAARYAAGVADYADLINGLYWLLATNKEARAELKSTFRYYLVDEFQDTDRAQLELLRLLADENFANVTVVGDDKQAIYEWRGARIENLREFPAEEKFLTANYRSCNEILDMANYSITRDPYFAPRADEIKLVNDVKGYAGPGHVRLARLKDRDEEAGYLAEEIEELLNSGVEPGQVAVLYRSKTFTKLLEGELRRLGIPYTALGDGFYEREEIRDLIAILRLAVNPGDDLAAMRTLQRPPVSLSQAETASLRPNRGDERPFIELASDPAFADSLPDHKAGALRRLTGAIESVRAGSSSRPLAVLVEMAFRRSGYFDALASATPAEAARSISNVSKIVELAAEFESRSPLNGLPELVGYLGRLLDMDRLGEAEADPSEDSGAVRLLTVHRAKGLEFDYVFCADMRVTLYRRTWQFLLDMPPAFETPLSGRVVAKYPPGSRNEAEAYDELLLTRDARSRHEQEERRVTYVALTRAREALVLATAARDSGHFDELLGEFAGSESVMVIDMTVAAG